MRLSLMPFWPSWPSSCRGILQVRIFSEILHYHPSTLFKHPVLWVMKNTSAASCTLIRHLWSHTHTLSQFEKTFHMSYCHRSQETQKHEISHTLASWRAASWLSSESLSPSLGLEPRQQPSLRPSLPCWSSWLVKVPLKVKAEVSFDELLCSSQVMQQHMMSLHVCDFWKLPQYRYLRNMQTYLHAHTSRLACCQQRFKAHNSQSLLVSNPRFHFFQHGLAPMEDNLSFQDISWPSDSRS